MQLRLETYNTFNNPEFDGVDTAAKFNSFSTGANQINGTFGQINDSAGPHVVQLAGRIEF